MTQRLDEPEAREILEELARTGPPTARVAAIRVLLKLNAVEREEEGSRADFDAFDELYDVEMRPNGSG